MAAKKSKRKPRFRVGQMIVLRGERSRTDYGRRILGFNYVGRTWRYSVTGAHCDGGGYPERELRPLTSREKGKP